MKSRVEGIIGASFNYFFIGLSFLFTKLSVSVAPTFIVLSLRFIISFVIISIILLSTKNFHLVKDSMKRDWKYILLFSIFQPLLFFTFQALALNRIASTEVGLVSATSPSIVAILGFILLSENLTPLKIGGLILSLTGIIFIYIMKGILLENFDVLGIIFIVIATISGALYQVMGKKLAKSHDPVSLAYIRIVIGAIIFPILGFLSRDWFTFQFNSLESPLTFFSGIMYLAIFTTVGTSLLTVYSLKRLKSAEQGIFANLATIVSITAGILFLNEPFYWYQIIGGILVIFGVILMNYTQQNKKEEISLLKHDEI